MAVRQYDAVLWLCAVISKGYTVFSVLELKKHNLYDRGFLYRAKSSNFIRKVGRTKVPNSSPRNRWAITECGFRCALEPSPTAKAGRFLYGQVRAPAVPIGT